MTSEKSLNKQFLETLGEKEYILFENEKSFILRFFSHLDNIEIINFCMTTTRCRFVIMLETGQSIIDTIPTIDFLEWCESVKREESK